MAPWSEAYILAKLTYYDERMEATALDQAHEYSGPSGNFDLQKASMKSLQSVWEMWYKRLQEWYPGTSVPQPQVEFNEVHFQNG